MRLAVSVSVLASAQLAIALLHLCLRPIDTGRRGERHASVGGGHTLVSKVAHVSHRHARCWCVCDGWWWSRFVAFDDLVCRVNTEEGVDACGCVCGSRLLDTMKDCKPNKLQRRPNRRRRWRRRRRRRSIDRGNKHTHTPRTRRQSTRTTSEDTKCTDTHTLAFLAVISPTTSTTSTFSHSLSRSLSFSRASKQRIFGKREREREAMSGNVTRTLLAQ